MPTITDKRKRLPKPQRINAILMAAREEFEEKGYGNATVADIAAKIGVVEGTVFHYFGSKHKLAIKVMEQFYQQITSEVEKGLIKVNGTRNRFYFIIRFHLKTFMENADLCSVILGESRNRSKVLDTEIEKFNINYSKSLIQVINQGIESGDINDNISKLLILNTVYGTIEHSMWDLIRNNKKVNINKTAQQLTNLIFDGVASHKEKIATTEVNELIGKLNKLL